jgi:hypothetical protein
MKTEFDKLLCERYPKLMVNRNKSMKETCMCWGFECGSGWFNILNMLMNNIQNHIDWSERNHQRDAEYNAMISQAMAGDITNLEKYFGGYLNAEERMQEALNRGLREVEPIVPQVTVDQVKEKFGSLRFYYSGGDPYIRGLVSMAESMSSVTCETCGNPAEVQNDGGWYRSICNACEEQKLLKQGYEE